MSMWPVPWPGVPELTAQVAWAAFPKGALAMRMRDLLGPVFADEAYVAAYGVRGRPGISPGQLMMVTVLQFVEDLPDRQAAEAVAGRIDWKYCLGLPLDHSGFDFSVLSEFRARLVEHDLTRAGFDAVLDRCRELGLVKAGGKQRTDATHVISAVRDMSRLELTGESVRALAEALAQVAPDWLAAAVDVHQWADRYGPRVTSWSTPRSKAKRDALAAQYGTDGHTLLAALWSPSAPVWLRELPQAEVLRIVLLQQYLVEHRADGSEVIRRREDQDGLPPGRDRLASPYDLDARWAAKGAVAWSGYKLHLTETCDDPPEPGPEEADGPGRPEPPNLITAVHTTPATDPDSLAVDPIHAQLAERGLLPGEHYLDAGYPSVEGIVAARAEYGVQIISPLQIDHSPQAKAGRGYARADFAFDHDTRTATCPNGQTSTTWNDCVQHGVEKIVVTFPHRACNPCPVRAACTTRKVGGRQLTIHRREIHEIQTELRTAQGTQAWQERYKRRSGIEGTMHQVVTVTGVRHARYRGLPKVQLEHHIAATAINLVRLDAYFTEHALDRGRTSHLEHLDLTLAA
jgi:transposase